VCFDFLLLVQLATIQYVSSELIHTFNSVNHARRVHTDPGKVWKVLEFNLELFKALKSLENDHRYGIEKSGKILENCNADLENADVYYTVDYRCIC